MKRNYWPRKYAFKKLTGDLRSKFYFLYDVELNW